MPTDSVLAESRDSWVSDDCSVLSQYQLTFPVFIHRESRAPCESRATLRLTEGSLHLPCVQTHQLKEGICNVAACIHMHSQADASKES